MEIGIDDDLDSIQDDVEQAPKQEEISQEDTSQDAISMLLKERGIDDKDRIKFENDNGDTEEVSWDTLSEGDKYNILKTSERDDNTSLDDSEIQLINAIRSSQLTPEEYLQYVGNNSVNNYVQSMQAQQPMMHYIDQYSDDELYVMDLLSKAEGVTEQEALEALNNAKSNESLFKKQVDSIRNDYRRVEDESIQNAQMRQNQEQEERFAYFADSIADQIDSFNELYGYELNMTPEDKQDLYDFILGQDNAGNSYFGKALNDPQTLVQMAWYTLNGGKMVRDMTDYFQKEITNVRKESYQKGVQDALNGRSNVTYKPRSKNSQSNIDDLDNF